MVDAFNAAGGGEPRGPRILSAVPDAKISAETIVEPMKQVARSVGWLGEQIDQATVDLNRQAGTKSVTRDADGNVTMTTSPFEFSAGDRAANAAARQGALAMLGNDATRGIADLHTANLNDPAGFERASKAFVSDLVSKAPGDLRPALKLQADELVNQHLKGLSLSRARLDVDNSRTAITARIEDLTNTTRQLAAQSGIDTPEYARANARIKDSYDALVSNPAYGVPREKADLDLQKINSMGRLAAVRGQLDTVFATKGAVGAREFVDTAENDPSLHLSASDRASIASDLRARIGYLEGVRKQEAAVNRQGIDAAVDSVKAGRQVAPLMWDTVIDRARNLGDAEGFERATQYRRQFGEGGTLAGANSSSDATRGALITGGGGARRSVVVAGAISQAAQKYGLDEGLLNRIAHIESRFDPNADNGSAKGLFQFIPGTWKQYGAGGDVFDPAANADAAARLLVANRTALRSGLGRDPTAGEIYLAHQQGAGGALELLRNPTKPAADIVGSKAVTGNGGTPGMSAGAFAELWIRKVDGGAAIPGPGTGTAVPPIYSGVVTTASMPAAAPMPANVLNPYTLPQYLRALSDNEDLQIAHTRDLAKTVLEGLKHDQLPSAENGAVIMQMGAKFPKQLGETANQVAAQLAGGTLAGQLLDMPEDAARARLAEIHAKAQGSPDIFLQQAERAANDWYERGLARMKANPVGEGAARGWYRPVAPIDYRNADTIAQGLGEHAIAAVARAAHSGSAAEPAFGSPELERVKSISTSGTLDQRLALIAGIAQMPDAIRNATFAQIGQSGETAVLAFAGGLAAVAPDVARSILLGQDAIKNDARYVPSKGPQKEAFTREKDTGLPVSAFPPAIRMDPAGPLAAMGQAIDARYAFLASQAGDTSGAVNTARLRQAASDVTGGVLRQNGAPVIAPTRGMTQRDFDGVMMGLSDGDLQGVTTGNGRPITADYVRGSAKLQAVGDGSYLVQLNGNDAAPMYASKDGRAFVLNLKGRQPAARVPTPRTDDYSLGMGIP